LNVKRIIVIGHRKKHELLRRVVGCASVFFELKINK